MAVIIDTSSLVMIARNYLPLDKSGELLRFIEDAFNSGELLLLDAVLSEAKRVAQGIVLERMPFLGKPELAINTKELLPIKPKEFSHLINNSFVVTAKRKMLSDVEFDLLKQEFLTIADSKIILYCFNLQRSNRLSLDDSWVMTDETHQQNDGKLYKKLPILCDIIDVNVMTAVDFLNKHGFELVQSLKPVTT